METLATFDTVNTADCVESCPVAGFKSSMVVSTYQLHKAAEFGGTCDRRSGTLQRFHLDCNGATDTDHADVTVCKLEEATTSSGVFDIKWNTQAMNDKAILGVATAGGSIELYELAKTGDKQTLRESGVATDEDTDSMCLSLDWNNRVHTNAQPSICASHSNGYVFSLAYLLQCNRKSYHFFTFEIVGMYRSGTLHHRASFIKLRYDMCARGHVNLFWE